MPRHPATPDSELRVRALVDVLLRGLDHRGDIATVAAAARLPHETVRRLVRNPGGGYRSGPGFFIVEAIARARGMSLDRLSEDVERLMSGERDGA